MEKKKKYKKLWISLVVLVAINLVVNLIYVSALYSVSNNKDLKGELALTKIIQFGAEILRISKKEAICRVIGEDVNSGRRIISCFYGHRGDASRERKGEEVTNVRILAFEELYFGGTFTDGKYNKDGEYIGKFRKDFKYNDNADVFWKVEVGLNGSTLEFCSMRDMEYSDTSRTKESCQSLNIDIQ